MTPWDEYVEALGAYLCQAPEGAIVTLQAPGHRHLLYSRKDGQLVGFFTDKNRSGDEWRVTAADAEVLRQLGWFPGASPSTWAASLPEPSRDRVYNMAWMGVTSMVKVFRVSSPGEIVPTAKQSDRELDVSSLRFPLTSPVQLDTSGWRAEADGFWIDERTGAGIKLIVQDFPLTEPYWLDDLDHARAKLAHDYGKVGGLIQADAVTIGAARGMAQLFKVQDPRRQHGLSFCVSLYLAKATRTVCVNYVIDESGTTGERETLVMMKLGNFLQSEKHPYAPDLQGRLPYLRSDEEAWDEQFPDHALSRARRWIRGIDRRLKLDRDFALAPDFLGTTRAGRD
jgi:hypothetical protein